MLIYIFYRRPFNAPESFVEDDDKNLYTGLKDGRIVKIYPLNGVVGAGNTEVIASVKFDGKDSTFDIKHGRPLGKQSKVCKSIFVFSSNSVLQCYQYTLSRIKIGFSDKKIFKIWFSS